MYIMSYLSEYLPNNSEKKFLPDPKHVKYRRHHNVPQASLNIHMQQEN